MSAIGCSSFVVPDESCGDARTYEIRGEIPTGIEIAANIRFRHQQCGCELDKLVKGSEPESRGHRKNDETEGRASDRAAAFERSFQSLPAHPCRHTESVCVHHMIIL